MKKIIFLLLIAAPFFVACNNEATTETTADSSNKTTDLDNTTNENSNATLTTDQASTDFLVKAAEGGLAEVEAGTMAEGKASHSDVKRFASMMVHDHSSKNEEVKSLASGRNVSLPAAPPADKKEKTANIAKKSGKDFDKSYMDMMVADHKETISLFEKAQGDSKDEQVKSFITSTLPALKNHLDSAQAIRAKLK